MILRDGVWQKYSIAWRDDQGLCVLDTDRFDPERGGFLATHTHIESAAWAVALRDKLNAEVKP